MDSKAAKAREHHRAALLDNESAARHRRQRDQLIFQLRRDDLAYWTHARIARLLGCSPELVAKILRNRHTDTN